MDSRTLSGLFVGALTVGAYAGCSSGDGVDGYGGYHHGGTATGDGTGGGGGNGGGGGTQAADCKTQYIQQVDPAIRGTCAGCHATGTDSAPVYLASTPDASYQTLVSTPGLVTVPDNSLLLLHGAHTGPALTASQATAVKSWLQCEATARGMTAQEGGVSGLTVTQALQQFAACMDYTQFTDRTQYGVSAADVARAQTTRYGTCNACHNAGDGGFWASYGTVLGQDMVQTMFQNTQQFPYIKKWVTGTVGADGMFKDLQASNSIADKAAIAAQCTQGTACHPKFALSPEQTSAINDFVQKTLDKWHNHQCSGGGGPPKDAGAD